MVIGQPQVALVDQEHEGFQVALGVVLFLDHVHDEVERILVLENVGVVDQEDDAARLGFAEQFDPVGLPHFVLAADVACWLEAHHLVADVRAKRPDRIAAGGGRRGLEFLQRGDVLAQPLDQRGLAGLARAEDDKRQPEDLDVDEIVNPVGALRQRIDEFDCC